MIVTTLIGDTASIHHLEETRLYLAEKGVKWITSLDFNLGSAYDRDSKRIIHFAAARNLLLAQAKEMAKASGTPHLIMRLDADERISPEIVSQLLSLEQRHYHDRSMNNTMVHRAYSVFAVDSNRFDFAPLDSEHFNASVKWPGVSSSVRILDSDSKLSYAGEVHEVIVNDGAAVPSSGNLLIPLIHEGYSSSQVVKSKIDYYSDLSLAGWITDGPSMKRLVSIVARSNFKELYTLPLKEWILAPSVNAPVALMIRAALDSPLPCKEHHDWLIDEATGLTLYNAPIKDQLNDLRSGTSVQRQISKIIERRLHAC